MTKLTPVFWKVVARGASLHCPKCGLGNLFSGYLTQVVRCSSCDESLGDIRADDGPAWLTIVIVGHILAPLLLFVLPKVTWPDWQIMSVIMTLMISLTLIILPRAKGVFIGMIWRASK